MREIATDTCLNQTDGLLENRMNEYWDDRSESYSGQIEAQLAGGNRAAWEQLIFHGIGARTLKVLDIGTGPGFFAIIAAQRGHDVTAVDMNAGMLDMARKNAVRNGVYIDFRQVDNMLPFESESFDLITSRDVTWTLTHPEHQLLHWASLLKPGGTMLYFDAEWYGYLRSETRRMEREEYLHFVRKNGGFIYNRSHELEQLARGLPMTYHDRPAWDIRFWGEQPGYELEVQENLNSYVYTDLEQIQYKLFPMFLMKIKRV